MSSKSIEATILSFWFRDSSSPNYGKPQKIWFESTPSLDQYIRDQFENLYQEAITGKLNAFLETPEGSLALVILLDQFPRNMYRGTPQAFASDQKALNVAEKALAKGFDQQLLTMQRAFLYLPFEHRERIEDQEKSINLFRALKNEENLNYAINHYDIIARFGRFPHRNAILGRKSTPEEIRFLTNSEHSGFGQMTKIK